MIVVEVALIAPIPSLAYSDDYRYQMMLAHLADNKKYVEYYRKSESKGTYLILDNGAHEGAALPMLDLLRVAGDVRADDVALPDVPGNAMATKSATAEALDVLLTTEGQAAYTDAGSPRLMLIPQGRTFEAWSASTRQLLRLHANALTRARVKHQAPVVAVAKHHVDRMAKRKLSEFRDEIWSVVHKQGVYEIEDVPIHALGWPRRLWTLAEVADDFRSVDSCRPFVYAMKGIQLEPGGKVPTYPGRPKRYFTHKIKKSEHEPVMRNIEVFRAAARNELVI